ncbi:hypothetical protein AKO1_009721 [Acrasis kona]|uniref:Uncharacterized protein n=1 Tax=Acrasis kona TaxID=1008807 RepID=A0AAW2ZNI7_9EUKA
MYLNISKKVDVRPSQYQNTGLVGSDIEEQARLILERFSMIVLVSSHQATTADAIMSYRARKKNVSSSAYTYLHDPKYTLGYTDELIKHTLVVLDSQQPVYSMSDDIDDFDATYKGLCMATFMNELMNDRYSKDMVYQMNRCHSSSFESLIKMIDNKSIQSNTRLQIIHDTNCFSVLDDFAKYKKACIKQIEIGRNKMVCCSHCKTEIGICTKCTARAKQLSNTAPCIVKAVNGSHNDDSDDSSISDSEYNFESESEASSGVRKLVALKHLANARKKKLQSNNNSNSRTTQRDSVNVVSELEHVDVSPEESDESSFSDSDEDYVFTGDCNSSDDEQIQKRKEAALVHLANARKKKK